MYVIRKDILFLDFFNMKLQNKIWIIIYSTSLIKNFPEFLSCFFVS